MTVLTFPNTLTGAERRSVAKITGNFAYLLTNLNQGELLDTTNVVDKEIKSKSLRPTMGMKMHDNPTASWISAPYNVVTPVLSVPIGCAVPSYMLVWGVGAVACPLASSGSYVGDWQIKLDGTMFATCQGGAELFTAPRTFVNLNGFTTMTAGAHTLSLDYFNFYHSANGPLTIMGSSYSGGTTTDTGQTRIAWLLWAQ